MVGILIGHYACAEQEKSPSTALVCLHFCIDLLSFGAHGILANGLNFDFHRIAEQDSTSLPDLPEQSHHPPIFSSPKRVGI